jgi:hypothetical protein
MKITRKGNRKGLDIDYEVSVENPEEVDKLHHDLLKKGLLFTYATGGLPYETPTRNTVLHYVDKDHQLYDFAILFTEQAPRVPKERTTKLDMFYERAKHDAPFKRRLMKYMRLYKILYAMIHHLKAYGTLEKPYKKILDEVFGKDKHEYTIESLEYIKRQKLLELE